MQISNAAGDDYTKVTFHPDLAKFKMEELEDDIVSIMARRAVDMAGILRDVRVMLNGEKLPVSIVECFITRQAILDHE